MIAYVLIALIVLNFVFFNSTRRETTTAQPAASGKTVSAKAEATKTSDDAPDYEEDEFDPALHGEDPPLHGDEAEELPMPEPEKVAPAQEAAAETPGKPAAPPPTAVEPEKVAVEQPCQHHSDRVSA